MPSQNHVLPTHPVPLGTIAESAPSTPSTPSPHRRRDASALGERRNCPAVIAEGCACCCPPRPQRVTSATHPTTAPSTPPRHPLHRSIHSIHSIRSIHSVRLQRRDASSLGERRECSAVITSDWLCVPPIAQRLLAFAREPAPSFPVVNNRAPIYLCQPKQVITRYSEWTPSQF